MQNLVGRVNILSVLLKKLELNEDKRALQYVLQILQISSKITQLRSQNENLKFLGQKLWGKHSKNCEFQCLSGK